MLLPGDNLARYSVEATDGSIGRVEDFYFEDDTWVVRYMVVNTKPWLPGYKKLISPISVESVDPSSQVINVDVTKEQIKQAPPMDAERPVSRQQERDFYRYYGYGTYWPLPSHDVWGPTAVWGGYTDARTLANTEQEDRVDAQEETKNDNPHLRSLREITGSFTGYDIAATDGSIGHVDNVLIKNNSWHIQYFVVDTGRFLSGDHVVISTNYVKDVSWDNGDVSVQMSKKEVEQAPSYDPQTPLSNDEDPYFTYYNSFRN
ncbi:PRC-barrel domain-containing protein [Alteribacillus iranensis]|uniref:PRC-barrel domain-containing protein n=1 Tax=Alteribacillus iranensis TaxID=930128 RepID=A0A1I2EXJ1_9BACI|nr:PRC-barrel domain-containing protein [Alteribacillus iranensis]SFE97337.1 hypothetical protein SAMN05192532_10759 [Alteribacillus iranensis]